MFSFDCRSVFFVNVFGNSPLCTTLSALTDVQYNTAEMMVCQNWKWLRLLFYFIPGQSFHWWAQYEDLAFVHLRAKIVRVLVHPLVLSKLQTGWINFASLNNQSRQSVGCYLAPRPQWQEVSWKAIISDLMLPVWTWTDKESQGINQYHECLFIRLGLGA